MGRRRVTRHPESRDPRAVDIAVWLGAGALTLGVGGAVLSGGCAVAHADDSGGAKSATGNSARHSPGPKSGSGHSAGATHNAGTQAVAGAAQPVIPSTHAAADRHVALSLASVAHPRAHGVTAAAVAVTPPDSVTAPQARAISASPLQSLVGGVVKALVALGGMSQETPEPTNLWQQGLYSVARWLADTVNPAGIPVAQTISLGTPDPLTGVITGRAVFSGPAGVQLAYRVTVDPALGSATIDSDGAFTFTPLQSTVLGAPDGGMTVKMLVTGYNGVQSTRQASDLPIANPWGLTKVNITVGDGPATLAINGNRLVVTNYNDGTASVIDTTDNHVINTIAVGSKPLGVVFDPSGFGFYVVNNTGTVSTVSLLTNSVIATTTVGSQPSLVVLAPANTPVAGRLYVTNLGDGAGNTVSVVDTATKQVINTITVGPVNSGPQGIAISPDGTRLWVANSTGDSIVVINTATNALLATIPVGQEPEILALSPDGKTVYVANHGDNTFKVYSTASLLPLATVSVGTSPAFVAVSPDGSVVYVANQGDNTISVINAATKKVIKTVSLSATPAGLLVSPDGKRLYVANFPGHTVTVIPV